MAEFAELYPQHARLEEKKKEHDVVEDFLHWLENHPTHIISHYATIAPVLHEDVIAEYFGIDKTAFSREKDDMLRRLRATGSITEE